VTRHGATALPTGSKRTVKERPAKVSRRFTSKIAFIVAFAALFSFQTQQSNHSLNKGHFAESFIVITVIFGALAASQTLYLIREVQVGDDWIAVRNSASKKWVVVHGSEIVGITLQSSFVRKYFGNGEAVQFADSSGRKAEIPVRWIAKSMAQQLLSVCGNVSNWPAGFREKLTALSA
jgi:hypothetical protein